jgi:hypothetical protein
LPDILYGGLIMENQTQRIRMNVGISTKGLARLDVTTEYIAPEETTKNLDFAIDKVRRDIKEKGLTETGPLFSQRGVVWLI